MLIGFSCALVAPGCAAPYVCPTCTVMARPSTAVAETLPGVERGDLEALLLGVASTGGRLTPVQFTSPLKSYRSLTPGQCAALAASSSTLAGLLQLEAQAGPERAHHPSRTHCTQQMILTFVSLEARNRSAGAALEAYFHLAKAEATDDLLAKGLHTVEDAAR
jgi:hypothetical protein